MTKGETKEKMTEGETKEKMIGGETKEEMTNLFVKNVKVSNHTGNL